MASVHQRCTEIAALTSKVTYFAEQGLLCIPREGKLKPVNISSNSMDLDKEIKEVKVWGSHITVIHDDETKNDIMCYFGNKFVNIHNQITCELDDYKSILYFDKEPTKYDLGDNQP